MTRRSIILTIPSLFVTVGSSILIATACAPQSDHVSIRILPKSPVGKATEDCLTELKQRTVKVRKTIRMCAVPVASLEGSGHDDGEGSFTIPDPRMETTSQSSFQSSGNLPSPKDESTQSAISGGDMKADTKQEKSARSSFSVVERPVKYEVSSSGDRLVVWLRVGLELPKGATSGQHKLVQTTLTRVCLPKIKSIFRGARMELKMSILDELELEKSSGSDEARGSDGTSGTSTAGGMDQKLVFVSPSGRRDKFAPLALADRPDLGNLWPFGLEKDFDSCSDDESDPSPSDPPDGIKAAQAARDCRISRFKKSERINEPFCRGFAILVGHWVGLAAADVTPSTCEASMAETTAAAGAAPVEPATLTADMTSVTAPPSVPFLKVAQAEKSSEEFWKKVWITADDAYTIMSPACSSFRNAKDLTKAAVLAVP